MALPLVTFVDEKAVRVLVLSVFEELRSTLRELLPDVQIEHIGSTSIPGSLTKGDLDVCVIVERSAFREADRVLAERFARNIGSHKTESFSSFVDDAARVPVGIQLAVRGGAEDFFVRWRELLARSTELVKEYNELKAAWHGRSHEGYREAKSRFIEARLGVSPR
jgi:GrpB-like predicted nucleotidyltransferase (UPF0157 family)